MIISNLLKKNAARRNSRFDKSPQNNIMNFAENLNFTTIHTQVQFQGHFQDSNIC
jgi:hypothetical protein